MKCNEAGLQIIRFHEQGPGGGVALKAYVDPVGKATIGLGHTLNVVPGMTCTKEQAERWFLEDVENAEQAVMSRVKAVINENEFSALVSFVFNIKRTKWNEEKCTLLRMLNEGAPRALVAKEFHRWNKGEVNGVMKPLDGLTARRADEYALFLKPVEALEGTK